MPGRFTELEAPVVELLRLASIPFIVERVLTVIPGHGVIVCC